MSISGRILKKIVGAVTEAFPAREKLVMMLEFELSIAESYVPLASDYEIVVYQLVKKLDSEGKIIDLIDGACRDNGNQNLQLVKQKIIPIIKLYQILAPLEKDFIESDIDLPNDLLNIFEEGQYDIAELSRIADVFPEITVQTSDNQITTITQGKVQCQAFPFIILTSNGEREFPPAFLRRCLRLDLREPTPQELAAIVKAHLGSDIIEKAQPIIEKFIKRRNQGDLATDQLLNAIYMLTTTDNTSDSPMVDSHDGDNQKDERKARLIERLLQYLNATGGI